MEGVEGDHPLLDCSADLCSAQPVDVEVAMRVVVGMARSGVAAARLLHSRGESVFVTDSGKPQASAELDALGIPWEAGKHSVARFLQADEIVVSPGVPLNIPPLQAAREKGVPIISELELASRYLKGDIIGITGSNGKTTTTTLVGEILKAGGKTVQVGGNIGTAMCGLVDTSTPFTINVIEVSSFQLDAIVSFRPHVAALLNITPDHLDRYADFASYRRSKFRIFENQQETDLAVLNRDDANVYPPPEGLRARRYYFSRTDGVAEGAFRFGGMLYLNGTAVMAASDVRLRGEHNIENVLAALAITSTYRVQNSTLTSVISEFRGVEHRIEYVASVRGVAFFNDSKATNVDSAVKAVASFDRNVILILGGRDKGASYAPLMKAMEGKVKHILLIGEASDEISAAVGNKFPVTKVSSLEEAVQQGAALGAPGDVVLLSPACASFDMFDNYEHRGRVFKQSVQELPQ
jgi:UDP-N-acetylmuramoylalanine--D-glutamate ligase